MKNTMTERQFQAAMEKLNKPKHPRVGFRRGTRVERNLKAEHNRRKCRERVEA